MLWNPCWSAAVVWWTSTPRVSWTWAAHHVTVEFEESLLDLVVVLRVDTSVGCVSEEIFNTLKALSLSFFQGALEDTALSWPDLVRPP